MAVSFTTVAFASVIVTGFALAMSGPRVAEPPLSLTTPGLVAQAPPVVAAAKPPAFAFRSVSVELPSSDRAFPDGPNVAVISANCVACHSVGMVLTQPKLARATWEAEVNKMIHTYKAPVDAADVPAIVDYLASVKG